MLTIGPITLPRSAAELLDATDGYDAGAKVQLESCATETGSYAFVASETIVAGVEAIYFRDAAGTSATWYKTWVSKSDGSQPSERSVAFQVASQPAGYVSLADVKSFLQIDDTVDDADLVRLVTAAAAELTRRIGVFVGPSIDTLRLYDGRDAVAGGRRLWIPGGIRTLTQVRLAPTTGGTLTVATLADFLPRPKAQDRRTGMPAMRIDVSDQSSDTFPDGYDTVELTGTFGYAAVPDDLATLARMLVARMWADRSAGQLSAPTPSKFLFGSDVEMLALYRAESFPMVA